ncbi:aminoglycoside phosphotransferase family protein [Pseudoalteromonas tunicata]|jgi:aminoglycoside/choline kinase family phosphotransferase|uniref:Aminoglycoside phosphotransferase domain-containing protein n=1 Tax=Pseudoalteromonas tunicata D2 TaxID=87626 RepID=A4C9A0_9GAMM|nr:phosphotransferase [Pseudoalteromonas tunicata]ATC93669.1 hypothetical protein PTUN_a0965 [Pseudoalteromonas tunicata]AXT29499.1 phosphotransferase [Pseudoalteromonas tunicata]EAR29165.1 hypothetical protein PTD2_08974 [Pseudoalteromonas tunicata D2]
MTEREIHLNAFLSQQNFLADSQLVVITGDASFRKYYRITTAGQSFIVMDSNPDVVNNHPFIAYNRLFSTQGLRLPNILASDEQYGFFLLEDLGSVHLADLLASNQKINYYQQLIDLLPLIAKTPADVTMRKYDGEFVAFELNIFKEWLVEGVLKRRFSNDEDALWQSVVSLLTDNLLNQPQVTVHRDYHSRNLMYYQNQWVVIDYQDAVTGPVSYDLVSLLRDCYHQLTADEFSQLFDYGFKVLQDFGLLPNVSPAQFRRWFDLVGVQRHLKAAGIFCRLLLRDHKAGYVPAILPTLEYVVAVAKDYPELDALQHWLSQTLMPSLIEVL